jgi:hypothetical protein
VPSRPDLRRSLGREAIYGNQPDPAATPLHPAPAEAQQKPSWEELHRRATYHLPIDLQEAIAAEAERSGRSKSRVVTDALRAYLQGDGKRSTVNGRR